MLLPSVHLHLLERSLVSVYGWRRTQGGKELELMLHDHGLSDLLRNKQEKKNTHNVLLCCKACLYFWLISVPARRASTVGQGTPSARSSLGTERERACI